MDSSPVNPYAKWSRKKLLSEYSRLRNRLINLVLSKATRAREDEQMEQIVETLRNK